jgi:hypothetical protein
MELKPRVNVSKRNVGSVEAVQTTAIGYDIAQAPRSPRRIASLDLEKEPAPVVLNRDVFNVLGDD